MPRSVRSWLHFIIITEGYGKKRYAETKKNLMLQKPFEIHIGSLAVP